MNRRGMSWLLALTMGIMLPGLIVSVAEKCIVRQMPQVSTATTAPQSAEETIPSPEQEETVNVLLEDGSVAQMKMDAYLTGVLLREMPADFHDEALRAQAVVARTYTLRRHTVGQKHPSGAVCTEPSCCQGYCREEDYKAQGGTQDTVDRIQSIVRSTAGQVLTYNGALIEATYFSCSGGRTEDALAVWGSEIPYLQAVDSPGEEKAAHYIDTVKFTSGEFAARLGITPKGKPATWFGEVSYTDGGGVATMMIGGISFQGTQLRQKLGLRSTAFTVLPVGDTIHVTTKGFGHRVGMSQYGADAMAVGGSNYREILAHYYPGTVLDTDYRN